MIGHKTLGLAGFGAGLAEGLEEESAILVTEENGLATVAAIDDVVNRSGRLNAQFSGHVRSSGRKLDDESGCRQSTQQMDMKNSKAVLVMAILCFYSTGLWTVVGYGQVPDFARLDDQLHALIKDKSTPDPTLLEAISRLGKISEPPAFWIQIANDPGYTIQHRRRAVFALFRRHAEYVRELHLLGQFLESSEWFQERSVEKVPFVFGWVPVPPAPNEIIFTISVLGGWKIYMRVAGDVEESTVREILSGKEGEGLDMDLIITQYGYGDDYDEWLRRDAHKPQVNY